MMPYFCAYINPHTEPRHFTNKHGFMCRPRVKPSDVSLMYVDPFLTVVNIETQHHAEWPYLFQLFHVVLHHDSLPNLFLFVLDMDHTPSWLQSSLFWKEPLVFKVGTAGGLLPCNEGSLLQAPCQLRLGAQGEACSIAHGAMAQAWPSSHPPSSDGCPQAHHIPQLKNFPFLIKLNLWLLTACRMKSQS